MLSRIAQRGQSLRCWCQAPARTVNRRTLIAAPTPNQGPLLIRRADRALPDIVPPSRIWLQTLPIFFVVITASALALFNYQKSSSSIVNATLYALRTSEEGRKLLGDEIYFRDKFPWIWGEMNQLHGRIDISFAVKGTKGKGMMRFKSIRKTRMGLFETQEWSLETEDGSVIHLLDENRTDPFKSPALQAES
ncbi:MAG: hypothetical protein Q9195_003957 [Heterodermia aff. obscurata]